MDLSFHPESLSDLSLAGKRTSSLQLTRRPGRLQKLLVSELVCEVMAHSKPRICYIQSLHVKASLEAKIIAGKKGNAAECKPRCHLCMPNLHQKSPKVVVVGHFALTASTTACLDHMLVNV